MTSASVAYFRERRQRQFRWMGVLTGLLLAFCVISLGFGPAGWDWRLAFAWLLPEHTTPFSALQLSVVEQIRLPRLCLALLVGAVLAQTGAATQALCRNPLADPSIIGVSAGAAVMAVGLIALAPLLHISADFWLPYAAFAGALLATLLVYGFARQSGNINITTLLLVGVAMNALSFALIGLLSFFADDSSLRLINYWTMGSLAGASWQSVLQGLPLLGIAMLGLHLKSRQLNLLLLGESEARYMGVNTEKLKNQLVILIALGVGACVALTGLVGFIGLVVPHISRLLVGAEVRTMLPVCMLTGATVLLLSDWLARMLVSPAELPIGVITALLGAPVFIFLLRQQQRV